jgi:hypothetical protein
MNNGATEERTFHQKIQDLQFLTDQFAWQAMQSVDAGGGLRRFSAGLSVYFPTIA